MNSRRGCDDGGAVPPDASDAEEGTNWRARCLASRAGVATLVWVAGGVQVLSADLGTARRVDGNSHKRQYVAVKTTIDIPEPLYKQAKIRAIETGQTLKHLVLVSLSRELESLPAGTEARKNPWERRTLMPAFEKAMKAGAFRPAPGERDVTELISEDRDAR